jgi:prepilin-type processing-associated H-X9-DG protein
VIEVLVAVAILGICVGLLLPAVTSAREAARRAQCAGNLRQIGIALHSYLTAHGCLPPGRVKTLDPRFAGANPPCTAELVGRSLFVRMLGWLGQPSLYNALNQSTAIVGPENISCHAVRVGTLGCPSDPLSQSTQNLPPNALSHYGLADPVDGPFRMAVTSYSGCMGTLNVIALPMARSGCKVPAQAVSQSDGCFNDISPIKESHLTDGLSCTLAVVEKSLSVNAVVLRDSAGPGHEFGWYCTGNLGDTLLVTTLGVNPYSRGVTDNVSAIYAASSRHPSGVNAMMADGAVRFVSETIDSWPVDQATGGPRGAEFNPAGWWDQLPPHGLWQALSTRSGGELSQPGGF